MFLYRFAFFYVVCDLLLCIVYYYVFFIVYNCFHVSFYVLLFVFYGFISFNWFVLCLIVFSVLLFFMVCCCFFWCVAFCAYRFIPQTALAVRGSHDFGRGYGWKPWNSRRPALCPVVSRVVSRGVPHSVPKKMLFGVDAPVSLFLLMYYYCFFMFSIMFKLEGFAKNPTESISIAKARLRKNKIKVKQK